jgi:hypothetical protein
MTVHPDRHPSLEKLTRHVETFGWRCPSDTWAGYHARYLFACAHGHRSERLATPILYRSGPPRCADCETEAIRERWLGTVAARGGELVTGSFSGLLARYRLRCAAGHEWEAQGRKIGEGSWYPRCAYEARGQCKLRVDGLERLQARAQEKGGRCLSTGYTGTRAAYLFECAQGHRWASRASEPVGM